MNRRAIELLDQPNIEERARQVGYQPTETACEYQHRWLLVTLRFVTEQADGSGTALFREEIEAPGIFSAALTVAFLSTFIWVYLPDPFGLLLLGTAVLVFAALLTGFLFVPSPLARYVDEYHTEMSDDDTGGESVGINLPAIAEQPPPDAVSEYSVLDPQSYRCSCIGPSMTALLGGLVASGPVFLAGMPLLFSTIRDSIYVDIQMFRTWFVVPLLGASWMLGFWVVGCLLGAFIYAFEADETQIKIFPFDLVTRVSGPTPELTGGYFLLLGIAGVPLIALSNSYFLLPAIYRFSPARQWIYFLFPPTVMAASLPVFIYWWVVQNREYVSRRTIERLSNLSSIRGRIAVACVGTVFSYAVALSLVGVVRKYWSYLGGPLLNQNPLPVLEKPVLLVIILASMSPAVYLLLGVTYQVCSHFVLVGRAFVESTIVGESPHLNQPVRLIPEAAPRAFTLALGPWQYIFVTTGLRKQLSSRQEFTAIIAHEEGHLDTDESLLSDAQLGTLLPVLGMFTLTGKSVLYALANYRDRETAADDYAASRVGAEPLIDALDQLRSTDEGSPGAALVSVPAVQTPGTLARPTNTLQALERYFGLLFGSFALTRAHPSIDDRKRRLRDESRDDD
ncbi:M48 family metalloprotease [Halosimplex salinum]|uniref:M48 family metalloprotease n=1 Tax=Halosimplex salinum TaxID=1710538 RepID=UPI0013DDE7D5|nr:M48 family metalloprotease [Halosimplex salinum]